MPWEINPEFSRFRHMPVIHPDNEFIWRIQFPLFNKYWPPIFQRASSLLLVMQTKYSMTSPPLWENLLVYTQKWTLTWRSAEQIHPIFCCKFQITHTFQQRARNMLLKCIMRFKRVLSFNPKMYQFYVHECMCYSFVYTMILFWEIENRNAIFFTLLVEFFRSVWSGPKKENDMSFCFA